MERLFQVWDRTPKLDKEFFELVEQLRCFANRNYSLGVVASVLVVRLILEAISFSRCSLVVCWWNLLT